MKQVAAATREAGACRAARASRRKGSRLKNPGVGVYTPSEYEEREELGKLIAPLVARSGALDSDRYDRQSEPFRAACRDRAEFAVRNAEVSTLRRAIATFNELCDRLNAQGGYNIVDGEVDVASVPLIELEMFCKEHKFKARAVSSLKWLVNNLGFRWQVSELKLENPAVRQTFGVGARQAPCAELCMA